MIVVVLVVGIAVAMSVAGWVLHVRDALRVDLTPAARAKATLAAATTVADPAESAAEPVTA